MELTRFWKGRNMLPASMDKTNAGQSSPNTESSCSIAPTRSAARQLVGHRHIVVNGRVVSIPSFQLRPGDIVEVREKSKALEVITNSVEGRSNQYNWLEWDSKSMTGKFLNYPERENIPENIKEQLIVELYSK